MNGTENNLKNTNHSKCFKGQKSPYQYEVNRRILIFSAKLKIKMTSFFTKMSNASIRLECLNVLRICQIFYNLFSGMKKNLSSSWHWKHYLKSQPVKGENKRHEPDLNSKLLLRLKWAAVKMTTFNEYGYQFSEQQPNLRIWNLISSTL